jgi:hypothetical protein
MKYSFSYFTATFIEKPEYFEKTVTSDDTWVFQDHPNLQ